MRGNFSSYWGQAWLNSTYHHRLMKNSENQIERFQIKAINSTLPGGIRESLID